MVAGCKMLYVQLAAGQHSFYWLWMIRFVLCNRFIQNDYIFNFTHYS